jgi:polyphenol oxidase
VTLEPRPDQSGPPGRHGFSDTGHVSVRIRRVTTTRAGGVSKPPFDTFNLGDHVGDDPVAVAENRARLAAGVGLPARRVVWMNQVHGDRVDVVDGPRADAVDNTDALVTCTARLALAVVTADCVPVLMADARAGVAAAVHAGRVGAQRGVVARTLQAMLELGAQPEDISALLGPAVSGRNYEVPAAMADEVEAALPGSRTTTAAGTPGLDLRAGIACQLRHLGVTAIDIDPRCTVADPTLFSHRRDAFTGRLAALVWME